MLVPLSSEAVAVAEVVMVEMRLATEVTLYSVQVLGEEDKEIIVQVDAVEKVVDGVPMLTETVEQAGYRVLLRVPRQMRHLLRAAHMVVAMEEAAGGTGLHLAPEVLARQGELLAEVAVAEEVPIMLEGAVQAVMEQTAQSGCGFTNERHNKKESSWR